MTQRRIDLNSSDPKNKFVTKGSKLKQVASLIQELSYLDMKAFVDAFEKAKALQCTGSSAMADLFIQTSKNIFNEEAK